MLHLSLTYYVLLLMDRKWVSTPRNFVVCQCTAVYVRVSVLGWLQERRGHDQEKPGCIRCVLNCTDLPFRGQVRPLQPPLPLLLRCRDHAQQTLANSESLQKSGLRHLLTPQVRAEPCLCREVLGNQVGTVVFRDFLSVLIVLRQECNALLCFG